MKVHRDWAEACGRRAQSAAGWLVLGLMACCLWSPAALAQEDTDFDGIPDLADNCVFFPNPMQEDSGGLNSSFADAIGDACQCGDVGPFASVDGVVDSDDALTLLDWLLGNLVLPPDDLDRCSVIGGVECNLVDLVVLTRSAAFTPPAPSQVCAPAIP